VNFALQFVAVFLSLVVVDFAWAHYITKIAEKNAMLASLWSSAIMLFGSVAVVGYTHNIKLLPAAVIGAFVGTYLSVKRQEKTT
jgi:hypothetical protein